MKKYKLTYDEWKCIKKKRQWIRYVATEEFSGYIGVMQVEEVSEPQVWSFDGTERIVCDKGIKWISILPKDKYYCITAMLDSSDAVIVWYIDMIAGQGVEDDIPYYYDLYLDLIVYPDGTIIVDDMDELEDAYRSGTITEQQFHLAISTKEELENTLLADVDSFIQYTKDRGFHL